VIRRDEKEVGCIILIFFKATPNFYPVDEPDDGCIKLAFIGSLNLINNNNRKFNYCLI
jgi:hypothetical protein